MVLQLIDFIKWVKGKNIADARLSFAIPRDAFNLVDNIRLQRQAGRFNHVFSKIIEHCKIPSLTVLDNTIHKMAKEVEDLISEGMFHSFVASAATDKGTIIRNFIESEWLLIRDNVKFQVLLAVLSRADDDRAGAVESYFAFYREMKHYLHEVD